MIKFISDSLVGSIANAIREKDPDLNNPEMSPVEMPHYINILDPHGYTFEGGVGGAALNFGTNLRTKFQNNTLVMYPVISNQVTDMQGAFNNCRNIKGAPMCNNGVIYGYQMYRDCWNLTGEPTIPNKTQSLINASQAYYNCVNIHGNAYCGPNVTDMSSMFYNCGNLDGEILQISPAATNIRQAFYNCVNLRGEIPSNLNTQQITDSYQAFWNCHCVTGSPIVGSAVADMSNTYRDCWNITGNAVVSPVTTNMTYAYTNCYNLSNGISGSLVTVMDWAFLGCNNLKVAALNAPNVTSWTGAYENCENMTLGYVGPKTSGSIRNCFLNCRNMMGSIFVNTMPSNVQYTFANCEKLEGVYFGGAAMTDANSRMINVFLCPNRKVRLNVVCAARGTLTNFIKTAQTGCTMSTTTVLPADNKVNVRLPLTYSNGVPYGNRYYDCIAYSYNEEYNIYIYSLA